MPLTKKGQTTRAAMREHYGKAQGDRVFYASAQKGTIRGVHGGKAPGAAKQRKG